LDLGELSILIAVTAIILLAASQLISSYNRRFNILLDRKKLRRVAIAFSVLFLIAVGIRLIEIINSAS